MGRPILRSNYQVITLKRGVNTFITAYSEEGVNFFNTKTLDIVIDALITKLGSF